MKYRNCQFENRNLAELFSGCDKQLRQEIVHRQCSTSPLPDRKFCDRYLMPLMEQVSTLPKPKKPPIIEPSSLICSCYRHKYFHGQVGRKKDCLTHDVLLDRDAAFAIINTKKSDDVREMYI